MVNIYNSDKFENVFYNTKKYLINSSEYAVFDNTIKTNDNLFYTTKNINFELAELVACCNNEQSIIKNEYVLKPLLFYTGFDYEKSVNIYGIFKNDILIHKIIMLYTFNGNTENIILAMK